MANDQSGNQFQHRRKDFQYQQLDRRHAPFLPAEKDTITAERWFSGVGRFCRMEKEADELAISRKVEKALVRVRPKFLIPRFEP